MMATLGTLAINKNENQQLQRLLNACKGIPQLSPTEDPYSSSKPGVVTLTKVDMDSKLSTDGDLISNPTLYYSLVGLL
ncbi:hypothetical protein Tco_0493949, partial [Tanacetum coccineum]